MKKRKLRLPVLLMMISILGIGICFLVISSLPIIKTSEIKLENETIRIFFEPTFSSSYYCSLDKENWIESKDNSCFFPLENTKRTYYLKKGNHIIELGNNEDLVIFHASFAEQMIYLALSDSYQLNPEISIQGYTEKEIQYSSDDPKISVSSNGIVTGQEEAEGKILISLLDQSYSLPIQITGRILKKPEIFDTERPFLSGELSEEENDWYDQVLKDRTNMAGYPSRASVLAAARFLTLEFPYRIEYFFENGRNMNADGEGRYYHQGLYLHSSRYELLQHTTVQPGSWGSKIYCHPSSSKQPNGLDCSGFVSWVLLNGGYDPGDIGADDLCDIGEEKKITKKLVETGAIKAGDLVHNKELGAHIGIIIGIKDDTYYVAQSIWYSPLGVGITAYEKDKFIAHWDEVILMDDYYKNDGNYSAMW